MHRSFYWAVAAVALVGAPVLAGAGASKVAPGLEVAQTSAAPAESPVVSPVVSAVVVELFTSQGCDSCPPAEALLRELAEEDGIVALEFHIDYWDYIGWPDPFSSPELTARQRSYSKDLRLRYVYTPQMVVDGRYDVVGSRRAEVRAAITKAAARRKAVDVRLLGEDGGKAVIPAGHSPEGGATVWLAVYDDLHETRVLRGENAGRTLENRNVVREFVELGTWTGERMEIPLDLAGALARGRTGCAVLVQQGETGPIIGAVSMPFASL